MPTYEYDCKTCGHAFERFESITAQPDKKCPVCGKKKAERRISGGGGLIFKGSGFYTTDYRGSDYAEAAKKETSNGVSPATSETKAASVSTENNTAPAAPKPASDTTSKSPVKKTSTKKKAT